MWMSISPDRDGTDPLLSPPQMGLPQSLSSSGSFTGPLDGPKTNTSSVHPGGPKGTGLLGGETLDADELILQQMMMQAAEAERKRELVSWAETEFIKAKNARVNFERQWYLNMAFIAGRQYVQPVDIAGHGFRLTTPNAPPWRVRLVINKIRMALRVETAKLTNNKPIPIVVPATGENEDYAAAKVGEALVQTQFSEEDFGDTVRSWVWWGCSTGISFLKSHWDPTCLDYDAQQLPSIDEVFPQQLPDGSPVPPELKQQILAENPRLQEYLNTPKPAVGKIKYEVVSPFHVYVPNLLTEKIEDQPFVIQVMTMSPLWVKHKFPDAFPGDSKPQCDTRAANTIMDSVSIITKGAEDQQDACLVKEIWIKPRGHKDFPEGGMITIVNEKIVQYFDKWPSPFPEYPFYVYKGIPTGGFYPDAMVQDLIPLQKEYNRKRSQAIEIMNTMGRSKILYPEGSINPRKISSEPGQSIPYKQGYEKPTVMQGTEVPASFSNEIATLTAEFDDISGQHDISRGTAPSDVKSGTAISFLAEQDDTKLYYQVASIEAAMQKLGKHHLSYVSKYWDGNRIVKIVGRNNEYEALSWKQNALRGNTDVRIQSGSALPVSKAARTAQIVEFMTNGWLLPEHGMEMLDLGGMDKVLDEMLVDKRQAYRENMKLAQTPESMAELFLKPAPGPNGEPVPEPIPNPQAPGEVIQLNFDGTPFVPKSPIPVNSWDNHEAHIQYHNEFRKTQEFEVLPEAIKQLFELHVQMHQLALRSMVVNARGNQLEGEPPAPPAVGPDGMPLEEEVPTESEDGASPPAQ